MTGRRPGWIAAPLLLSQLAVAQEPPARYDTVRMEHRALASWSSCTIPAGVPLKAARSVSSPRGMFTATVYETDPVAVPYDRARACIQIRRENGPERGVSLGGFRTLRLEWVNDRVLYLFTDVGHAAGVGQLLDVEVLEWIYARTEYYWDSTAPSVDMLLRAIPARVPELVLARLQRHERVVTAVYNPVGAPRGVPRSWLIHIVVESFDTEEAAEAGRRSSVSRISVGPTRTDTLRGMPRWWWENHQVMARVGRHVVTVSGDRGGGVPLVARVFDLLAAEIERVPPG